jgi:hypothetical protein
MALGLQKDGVELPVDEMLTKDLLAYELASRGILDFAKYVAGEYDSSADYWLVKLDGTIEGTPGDPRIYRQYVDAQGNIVKELVPGSDETGSQAASLVALLGEDRVRQLLGLSAKGSLSVNVLDPAIVKELLGWTGDLMPGGLADNLLTYLTDTQRQRALGETLLKRFEYTWNEKTKNWDGTGLNIAAVDAGGNVGLRKEGNTYIPFTITSTMYRDANAYNLYVNKDGQWVENPQYKNNTTIVFQYTNLKTGEWSSYTFEGPLNSVDNVDGSNSVLGGADQSYTHPTLGTVQGATVASSTMNLRLSDSPTYGEVLLFTDFTDLKGDHFGRTGIRAGIPNDQPTLYHWTTNGYSDSCLVSYSVPGGLSGKEYFDRNMSYLKDQFKLYRGFEIKATLVDLAKP